MLARLNSPNNRRFLALLGMFFFVAIVVFALRSSSSINDGDVELETRVGRSILKGCPSFIVGNHYSKDSKGPKILLSTGAYNNIVDGVSKSLNHLVKDLLERGFQILVIAPVNDVPAMEHEGLLYPAHSMSVPFRPEYQLALGLDKCTLHVFEEFQPDIVQVATPDYLGSKVQQWAIDNSLPVVCSYHTRFNAYLPYYIGTGQFYASVDAALWAWMRSFYSSCDHTYPPTPSVAQELLEHGIESSMRIWPRGIDLSLFNPKRRSDELRAKWNAKEHIVVLTVCRLVWEKNLQEVIDTLVMLDNHDEPVRAVVVGEGPAKAAMQARLPNALFTGFLGGEDLAAAFASADVFFFPSLTETWGAVTLEAMASGLPVVVANAPGSKELVENGITGFLVKAGDPSRWANALTELIHNESLRKRFSENALAVSTDLDRFTWDRATNMIVSHYQAVLGDKADEYEDFFDQETIHTNNQY